jgi:hypothetical protein
MAMPLASQDGLARHIHAESALLDAGDGTTLTEPNR